MQNNLTFSVQTILVAPDGGTLKSVEPDKDGVFRGIPVTAIGVPSRNGFVYDTATLIDAITSPTSRFNINLTEGNLEGEWCHPFLDPAGNKKTAIARAIHIDRTRVSHYFTRLWTKNVNSDVILVYADIVPYGPYGTYLTESFLDAKRNTAFSLRAITDDPIRMPNGLFSKPVRALITFDAVDGPGFKTACKGYASAESLGLELVDEVDTPISIEDLRNAVELDKAVGFESINCQEVLDAFGCNKLNVTVTKSIDVNSKITRPTGNRVKSVFHSLY